jgi:predicted secreted protein
MAASKGRVLRVKACATSGGSYNAVAGVRSASISIDGQNVDVTTLTDADIVRIQAILDAKISMTCNYEADSTGQALVRAAALTDADLYLQFLPDGTNGWRAQYKVASAGFSGTPNGVLEATYECERTGAFTNVGSP